MYEFRSVAQSIFAFNYLLGEITLKFWTRSIGHAHGGKGTTAITNLDGFITLYLVARSLHSRVESRACGDHGRRVYFWWNVKWNKKTISQSG